MSSSEDGIELGYEEEDDRRLYVDVAPSSSHLLTQQRQARPPPPPPPPPPVSSRGDYQAEVSPRTATGRFPPIATHSEGSTSSPSRTSAHSSSSRAHIAHSSRAFARNSFTPTPTTPNAGAAAEMDDPTPSITVRRPTLIDHEADSSRSGSGSRSASSSPDRSDASSSGQPTRSHAPEPESPRTGMSITVPRPHSSQSGISTQAGSPLMGDISQVNTPISPSGNPFNDYRMGSSPAVSPAPGEGVPPETPHAHGNAHTGGGAGVEISPTNGFFPRGAQAQDEEETGTAPQRRSSLAPTFGTEKSAEASGVRGPLTAAERRNQRMSKITPKKRQSQRPAGQQMNRKPFQSTRLKEEIYKPWLEKKDPAQRWARWITIVSIILGFAIMGVLCWDGYNSIPRLGNTRSVLDEDWSGGIQSDRWTREVRTDGYGHGQFAWTTPFDNNSYVEDGVLYIVPHLTSDIIGEDAVSNGYTLNLTRDGRCTSTNVSQCVAVSNSSQLTVINPVTSARLISRSAIKYGKVEVVARIPTGDWLWPSITMLPVQQTYGPWPRSGEIEILTARGNNASYTQRGVDYAQSSLHWGPVTELDRLYMTWGYREQRRSAFNQKFHTYGFEWNQDYMWTYIDSRVDQVISLRFKQSFWNRGNFPSTFTNHTSGDIVRLTNPWINSENNVAPFDQPFYLALNLAVGGIDGWFPDGEGQKPWLDTSLSAMSDFWNARTRWWNNWPQDPKIRGFAIKSVKMWEVV